MHATAIRPRRRRRAWRVIGGILAFVLITAGIGIAGLSMFAPQTAERLYGEIRTQAVTVVDDVRAEVLKEYPAVTLGATGGRAELDRCDGTFTEVVSYQRDGVPPVWAAHNNCGGDTILAWQLGDQVKLEGDETVYEVVDVRTTSKTWSSTDDLVGLGGDLALQTCFYGEDRMKFVGLSPVA